MNLQNLFKQFGGLANLGGLGNLNMQNNQQSNNQSQNQEQGNNGMYPDSFNTTDFFSSRQYNQGIQDEENYNACNCNSNQCSQNAGNFNNQNNSYQQNNQNNNQNNNSGNGFLNGLLGPNMNISSLLPLLSLFNGKSGVNSLLKSENMPEGLKGLAPFISMLSSTAENKTDNPNNIKIDKLKKIED
ncbi:MAG: hypothetical protein PHS54_03515 [Clostridia bacterium]|nr:hypothetical protein [Clostridia bacterium]